jgi:hypothetical protein
MKIVVKMSTETRTIEHVKSVTIEPDDGGPSWTMCMMPATPDKRGFVSIKEEE